MTERFNRLVCYKTAGHPAVVFITIEGELW